MSKFCGECGSAFSGAQRFCTNCGAPRVSTGHSDTPAAGDTNVALAAQPEPEPQASFGDPAVETAVESVDTAGIEKIAAAASDVLASASPEAEPECEVGPRPDPEPSDDKIGAGETAEAHSLAADDSVVADTNLLLQCGYCSAPLESDSQYCAACGTPAGSAESPEPPASDRSERLQSPLTLAIGAVMLGAFLYGAWNVYGPVLPGSWQAEEAGTFIPDSPPDEVAPAAVPELPVMSETPIQQAITEAEEPALSGVFRATISDQSITLTFNGGSDRVIRKSQGVAHYANSVTGRECTNMFTAIESSWDGNSVVLKQSSAAGLPACDGKIDMQLTPIANGRQAARSISVQWLNPQGGADLMSGTLNRDPD